MHTYTLFWDFINILNRTGNINDIFFLFSFPSALWTCSHHGVETSPEHGEGCGVSPAARCVMGGRLMLDTCLQTATEVWLWSVTGRVVIGWCVFWPPMHKQCCAGVCLTPGCQAVRNTVHHPGYLGRHLQIVGVVLPQVDGSQETHTLPHTFTLAKLHTISQAILFLNAGHTLLHHIGIQYHKVSLPNAVMLLSGLVLVWCDVACND